MKGEICSRGGDRTKKGGHLASNLSKRGAMAPSQMKTICQIARHWRRKETVWKYEILWV